MTRALVITHSATEGVGTLGEWLPAAGLDLDVVEPWDGDALPETLDGYDALVVMGGPQQAYDDGSAPWLRATKDLLRLAVRTDVPTLGVCLGAQLLAEANGGRVQLGEDGIEAGARLVAKRDAAWDDPLLADAPFTPTVVQWHEDVIVDLPPGALLLASSSKYANQAFRVGSRAWGLQFHVETPPEMVRHWGKEYGARVVEAGQDPVALAERAVGELEEVGECWRPVMARFAEIAQGRGRTVLPLVSADGTDTRGTPTQEHLHDH
ncbi:MAG: putative glutamine amidotransferase [Frankiales bacterium]|nr:putative glutamine amidotransferase [Frankiales bacterium]